MRRRAALSADPVASRRLEPQARSADLRHRASVIYVIEHRWPGHRLQQLARADKLRRQRLQLPRPITPARWRRASPNTLRSALSASVRASTFHAASTAPRHRSASLSSSSNSMQLEADWRAPSDPGLCHRSSTASCWSPASLLAVHDDGAASADQCAPTSATACNSAMRRCCRCRSSRPQPRSPTPTLSSAIAPGGSAAEFLRLRTPMPSTPLGPCTISFRQQAPIAAATATRRGLLALAFSRPLLGLAAFLLRRRSRGSCASPPNRRRAARARTPRRRAHRGSQPRPAIG